jgi:hypothetical protein
MRAGGLGRPVKTKSLNSAKPKSWPSTKDESPISSFMASSKAISSSKSLGEEA